jgi:hypothetical protein
MQFSIYMYFILSFVNSKYIVNTTTWQYSIYNCKNWAILYSKMFLYIQGYTKSKKKENIHEKEKGK